MSRHEGDPVPHEHQFYRTTLRGLFSLDLRGSGTFSYKQKTGYRNLDEIRQEQAETAGLEHDDTKKTYRLSIESRLERITALLDGLAQLEGGAKQTIHYTDVAPPLVILAVTKGGNHIFGHIVGADSKRLPIIKTAALEEALTVFADEILSDIYVGWTQGYLDEERAEFEAWAAKQERVKISHPRQAYQTLTEALKQNRSWLA